jgi:hypothetical protein
MGVGSFPFSLNDAYMLRLRLTLCLLISSTD